MTPESLARFDDVTARWFARTLGIPTAVQTEAWPAIASGRDTLVSAPTGTGKTLAAFLVFIDRLRAKARAGTLPSELQLIYVSPLKSLAGDIRENLRRPLTGIAREEREAGLSEGPFTADLLVAVRTGDTPQADRRRMIKKPPHILITTPESLYLMLTAQTGQSILRTARWIILDELHALIDTKRGAHLMLTLARLDRLCGHPLQRIGLSATIRPLERAAAYLSPSGTEVVAPRMDKAVEIAVTSPHIAFGPRQDSIWQAISAAVFEHCAGTRTALAFVDGRAYAERLAYHVNQLGGEGFARTHHGSLSREQRHEVEHDLRSGTLRLLCATSSMELGIDVGEIDRVFQIGCPRSIRDTPAAGTCGAQSRAHQRDAHFPAGSRGGTVRRTDRGGRPGGGSRGLSPAAAVSGRPGTASGFDGGWRGVFCRRCAFDPPAGVSFPRSDRGGCPRCAAHAGGRLGTRQRYPGAPRLLYDRIHDRVEGDPYSGCWRYRRWHNPDRGLYTVRTETGVKIGELDEEFVFEARVGDRFLLGSFSWQILSIQQDRVVVSQSAPGGARPPFWKGEIKGRPVRTGAAFGALLHQLDEAHEGGRLREELIRMGWTKTPRGGGRSGGRQVLPPGVFRTTGPCWWNGFWMRPACPS
jgi:ATP-dependent Lhr-like helicase